MNSDNPNNYSVDDRGNVAQFYQDDEIIAELNREAEVLGIPDMTTWDGTDSITEWAMENGYADEIPFACVEDKNKLPVLGLGVGLKHPQTGEWLIPEQDTPEIRKNRQEFAEKWHKLGLPGVPFREVWEGENFDRPEDADSK